MSLSVDADGLSQAGSADSKRPTIVPRAQHILSRSNISENSLKVLYRLANAGFQAYLVGGGVRDLLLGRHPKDFDVVTDAHPEQVRELFRNCRLIGRRFLLAHVVFGRDIVEVATFRAGANIPEPVESGDDEDENDDVISADAEGDLLHNASGRILRDNIYGTLDDDIWRRDFTVNSLYYNISDFSLVDYAGGLQDLQQRLIRPLGDPRVRFREDPVRILRAIRFAAKLDFTIEPDSEQAIFELKHLLREVPPARLFDESLKLFLAGHALRTFELLQHYKIIDVLFPDVERAIGQAGGDVVVKLLQQAMRNTDTRIAENKPVTPAFLYAAILWAPVRARCEQLLAGGEMLTDAMTSAASRVVDEHIRRVSLPKRFSIPMREIWFLQHRLEKPSGRRPLQLIEHPRFRAAYDFLLLRAESGEIERTAADWWTSFQSADHEQRMEMMQPAPKKKRRRGPRRKGPPRDTASSGV
jgi:poly(A) polymerase